MVKNIKTVRLKIYQIINRLYPNYVLPPDNKELVCGGHQFLSARDLLYIFFEIENEFEIRFNSDDFVDGRFDTVNSIVNMIESKIKL